MLNLFLRFCSQATPSPAFRNSQLGWLRAAAGSYQGNNLPALSMGIIGEVSWWAAASKATFLATYFEDLRVSESCCRHLLSVGKIVQLHPRGTPLVCSLVPPSPVTLRFCCFDLLSTADSRVKCALTAGRGVLCVKAAWWYHSLPGTCIGLLHGVDLINQSPLDSKSINPRAWNEHAEKSCGRL